MRIGAREVITTGHAYNIRDLRLPGALSGKTGTAEFGVRRHGVLPFHSWFVAYLPSRPGATDADLAIVTFSYSAVVPGNVSLEVVKYFLQQCVRARSRTCGSTRATSAWWRRTDGRSSGYLNTC